MAKVQGTVDPAFAEVRSVFQSLIDSGEELGASISVNIDGKDVVDLWGGYVDVTKSREWSRDTIATMWSSSKTIVSLATLVLIDRGLVDPNEKVSKYWPEFAANGKDNVLVRHLLSHSSGTSGWDEPLTKEGLADFEGASAKLAAQASWWTPGSASGYEMQTFGHLLGKVIQGATGKTLSQFVAEEIAGPLGADFQYGAKEKDWPRIAELVPPPPVDPKDWPKMEPGSVAMRTMVNPSVDGTFANTELWRRSEIGAINGHGNAKAMTTMLSAISCGGTTQGVKLLSPQTIDLIFQEQVSGTDLVLGLPLKFGLGYALRGNGETNIDEFLPEGKIATWGGWGGSFNVMDAGRKVTISYIMNKMDGRTTLGNAAVRAYIKATYKALGVEI